MTTNAIISKVWSFCNTLRDDGVSYGDYLGPQTYFDKIEETAIRASEQ